MPAAPELSKVWKKLVEKSKMSSFNPRLNPTPPPRVVSKKSGVFRVVPQPAIPPAVAPA